MLFSADKAVEQGFLVRFAKLQSWTFGGTFSYLQ